MQNDINLEIKLKKLLNYKDFDDVMNKIDSNSGKTLQTIFENHAKILTEIRNLKEVRPDLMHNHLESNWNLSNKKNLFHNMKSYYESVNEDYTKYLPCKICFYQKLFTFKKEFPTLSL